MLITIYVLLIGTTGLMVWSMVRGSLRARSQAVSHGMPAKLIGRCVAGGTVLTLVLSFAFASTKPVKLSGGLFNNALWLRLADMLMVSAVVMIVIAIVAAIVSASGVINKR